MRRAVYRLADRLHKTPQEIREGFTTDDFVYFIAHCQLAEEELKP